jgi:prephenate dehydrogenase
MKLGEYPTILCGLGLMGGSLALALRRHCPVLYAVDPDPATLKLALQEKIVDCAAPSLLSLCNRTNLQETLIILATPVSIILRLLDELPSILPGHVIVFDLGSTKKAIIERMQNLPERFDPLGGHPMCGKEHSGLVNAEASLFHNAPFALTPLERTSSEALSLALELVQAAGGKPILLDAQTHDRWVAATSHLPYLLANALAAITPLETAPLVGPGFRSTARLAVTPSSVMLDVLETNRDNILSSLQHFQERLNALQSALQANDLHTLAHILEQGSEQQTALFAWDFHPPSKKEKDSPTQS